MILEVECVRVCVARIIRLAKLPQMPSIIGSQCRCFLGLEHGTWKSDRFAAASALVRGQAAILYFSFVSGIVRFAR